MEKILVLRGGALGDFIVTLPALALLRKHWPGAQIELAGNPTAAQLALARGLINRVHSQHEARWAGLFEAAPLPPEFRLWLASFDLVVSYWPDPDGELARHFPLHHNQQFLSASAMPSRAPAAAHYCEPLRSLGLQPRSFHHCLSPIAQGSDRAPSDFSQRSATILIHPGSGSLRKNWPAANWLRLIERLPRPVSLILGEAELPIWSSLGATSAGRELAHPSRAVRAQLAAPSTSGTSNQRLGDKPLHLDPSNLLVNRPLEELVGHLAECRLFLGHDSGISHLAAACGAKCVLLFGPTEPDLWAPPAPNVQVLRCHFDPASLSVDAVRHAVAEALADRR